MSTGTKTCGRCKEEQAITAFSRLRDGHQHWCKTCFRDYFAARGDTHRRQSGAALAARRERNARHVLEVLRASACPDCGETDPVVLEFDHVGPKIREISHLVRAGVKLDVIDREIAHCEIVCACCHRHRTERRRPSWRTLGVASTAPRRRPFLQLVHDGLARGCVDCGRRDLVTLEFDHVGPKRDSVMVLAWARYGLDTIRMEMDSCEVRCCNCHRRRTARVGDHHRHRAAIADLPP